MEEDAIKPHKKSYDWLKQYQFQKGNNANPTGRPKGKSLKTFAKEMLEQMDDEEKARYLKDLDNLDFTWRMAEGQPKQDMEVTGEMVTKIISVDE